MCNWKNEVDGGDFPTIKLGIFSFSDEDGRKFDFFSEQIVSGLTTQFKTPKKD